MMRYVFLLTFAALVTAVYPPAMVQKLPVEFSAPARITVITKNSEYPRLQNPGMATQSLVKGQWI